jgi:Ca2+-binding EF-hand superfamily protein
MQKMKWALIAFVCAACGFSFAGPAENLKRADKNEDGVLQEEEFVAMHSEWAEKKGKEVDVEKYAKMFKNKDKDGNGEVTLEEMAGN